MSIKEKYLEFVIGEIEKYSKSAELIKNDEISPQSLNRSLAEYLKSTLMILSELKRAETELYDYERDYKRWYNPLFLKVKDKLIKESQAKTAKVSVKEIEIQLSVDYEKEFYERDEKIFELKNKVSFLEGISEQYKKFDKILTTLSFNTQSEMKTYSLENRMNVKPEVVLQNRVRNRFPVEDMNGNKILED